MDLPDNLIICIYCLLHLETVVLACIVWYGSDRKTFQYSQNVKIKNNKKKFYPLNSSTYILNLD